MQVGNDIRVTRNWFGVLWHKHDHWQFNDIFANFGTDVYEQNLKQLQRQYVTVILTFLWEHNFLLSIGKTKGTIYLPKIFFISSEVNEVMFMRDGLQKIKDMVTYFSKIWLTKLYSF